MGCTASHEAGVTGQRGKCTRKRQGKADARRGKVVAVAKHKGQLQRTLQSFGKQNETIVFLVAGQVQPGQMRSDAVFRVRHLRSVEFEASQMRSAQNRTRVPSWHGAILLVTGIVLLVPGQMLQRAYLCQPVPQDP